MISKKRLPWSLVIVFCTFSSVATVDREITVSVEPGKEDCFFERFSKGDEIDVEYQVIDGGHGDLDITFRILNPTGRILVTDLKKSENMHRVKTDTDGDYKFCFDNTFSTFNAKTVFLELVTDGDDAEWESEEDMNLREEETYSLQLQEILESITNVRNNMNKVRHFQEIIKSTEARDRNVAEENYFKVNTFSMVQIFVMVLVGIIQVIMVRSLFDEKSVMHKFWKCYMH